MLPIRAFALSTVLACSFLLTNPLSAKPPAAPSPTPATATGVAANPLARWLLELDGQQNSISLPLREIVYAATGKHIAPFDPKSSPDAAFLTRLGTLMDTVLPRMNRSSARSGNLDEIAAAFEEEIRASVRTSKGFSVEDAPETAHGGMDYPSLGINDSVAAKTYYLAVTLYPGGKRELATRNGLPSCAFQLAPREGARKITSDGCCLLIGIEHNENTGKDMTFLNWDLVDVADLPVRARVTFDATSTDVYHPGAILTDGRKGMD